MAVYVDDMRAAYGRMVMCHMLADTDEELHAMADRIGVARRWHQKPGTHQSHYDIALSKRALAVAAGAIEITWRESGILVAYRRKHGRLGNLQAIRAGRGTQSDAPKATEPWASPTVCSATLALEQDQNPPWSTPRKGGF